MHQPSPAELRTLLALAAAAAVLYLLAAAWLELDQDRQAAGGPVHLEDLAPAEIARLMDEARHITRQAAPGGEL